MFNTNIPVLTYHSISNEKSNVSIDVREFEKQIKFLKENNFKSIFFNEIDLNEEKQIIITFDDGYKDIFVNALPILKKYNFKAICYVVANHIGGNNSWDNIRSNYKQLELMNKFDLLEWRKNNMMIGSHSLNHLDLTTLDDEKIDNELIHSKRILENLTSDKIQDFSYPYGKVNISLAKKVAKFYQSAVTVNRSRFKPKKHNFHLIPRIDMGKPNSKFKLFLKLNTIYEDIKYRINE